MLLPAEKGSDYWKVAHIPEVYSTYWREGWEVNSLESLSKWKRILGYVNFGIFSLLVEIYLMWFRWLQILLVFNRT
jgi:hypothetical protein